MIYINHVSGAVCFQVVTLSVYDFLCVVADIYLPINTNAYNTETRKRMPILSPLAAPEVVITTTCGATCDDKVVTMTILGFHWSITIHYIIHSHVSKHYVMTTMITSSNGNIFRVTGHSCGEFTGDRWIPRTKASDAERSCFSWSAPEYTVE